MRSFLEQFTVIKGLDAIADAFAGTVASDVVKFEGDRMIFLLHKGVGATGTSTLTVEACDDFAATNTTAIAFRYRRCCNTADTQGAITAAAAAGFATTAGSSEVYAIEVLAENMGPTGYPNVRLKAVEVVDSAVLGGILVLAERSFQGATHSTLIS